MIINGEFWDTFLFDYVFEGKPYDFTIVARSEEEAKQRLHAMQYAELIGHNVETIPCRFGTGLYVRFITWWRNLTRA